MQSNPEKRSQEAELVMRARDGNSFARDEMIIRYMPFAVGLAHKFSRSYHVEYDDAIQAACVGLLSAVDTWDIERGAAFSTVAAWTILQQLQVAERHNPHRAVTPPRQSSKYQKTDPVTATRADAAKRSTAKANINDLTLTARSAMSLEDREVFELAMARLNPREREVSLRSADGDSLSNVGRDWGLTRERARQIHASAMRKLRGFATECPHLA